jgi:hypothetical protein
MVTSRYLAVTAAELPGIATADQKIAFMACHFSPYAAGLSNIPTALPTGSMLILNDRIPICGHDPSRIADQLLQTIKALGCDSLLLDFQRPENAETASLCRFLAEAIPCPLGISHHYANNTDCYAFLSAPPLDMPLGEYLKPWKGRKIWLEAALETTELTIRYDGCKAASLLYEPPPDQTFIEEALHCRYRCQVFDDAVRVSLYRTIDQLDGLLEEAGYLGVEKAIGLYQQLGK